MDVGSQGKVCRGEGATRPVTTADELNVTVQLFLPARRRPTRDPTGRAALCCCRC